MCSKLCLSAENWITECGSKLIYELLPGKEVMYVVPISSILGKLPVVRAGDTGTIPHKYCTATRSCAHRYNAQLARADSRPGAGDGFCEWLGTRLVAGYVNHVSVSTR